MAAALPGGLTVSSDLTVEIEAGVATVTNEILSEGVTRGTESAVCTFDQRLALTGIDADLTDGVIDPPTLNYAAYAERSNFRGDCDDPRVAAGLVAEEQIRAEKEATPVENTFLEIVAQPDGSGTGAWGESPIDIPDMVKVEAVAPETVAEDAGSEESSDRDEEEGEAIGDCFPIPDDEERRVVGVVVATSGAVEIQRDVFGEFVLVAEGGSADVEADLGLVTRDSFLIHHGDVVRTAPGSLARIVSFEEPISLAALDEYQGTPLSELGGVRAKSVDLIGNSSLCLSDLHSVQAELVADKTVMDVLRGAIRVFADNAVGTGRMFSVEAGTTIAGSRNTDYIVAYDPDRGESTVLVNEGDVAVVSDDPERIVGPGTALVTRDGVGEVGPPTAISDAQWDAVVNATDPLEAIDALLNSSTPALGDQQDDNNSFLLIAIVAAALAAATVVAVFVLRGRSKPASTGT